MCIILWLLWNCFLLANNGKYMEPVMVPEMVATRFAVRLQCVPCTLFFSCSTQSWGLIIRGLYWLVIHSCIFDLPFFWRFYQQQHTVHTTHSHKGVVCISSLCWKTKYERVSGTDISYSQYTHLRRYSKGYMTIYECHAIFSLHAQSNVCIQYIQEPFVNMFSSHWASCEDMLVFILSPRRSV